MKNVKLDRSKRHCRCKSHSSEIRRTVRQANLNSKDAVSINPAGVKNQFNHQLLMFKECPLEIVTDLGWRKHGKLQDIGINYINILASNDLVYTVLQDKVDHICWLSKECKPHHLNCSHHHDREKECACQKHDEWANHCNCRRHEDWKKECACQKHEEWANHCNCRRHEDWKKECDCQKHDEWANHCNCHRHEEWKKECACQKHEEWENHCSSSKHEDWKKEWTYRKYKNYSNHRNHKKH